MQTAQPAGALATASRAFSSNRSALSAASAFNPPFRSTDCSVSVCRAAQERISEVNYLGATRRPPQEEAHRFGPAGVLAYERGTNNDGSISVSFGQSESSVDSTTLSKLNDDEKATERTGMLAASQPSDLQEVCDSKYVLFFLKLHGDEAQESIRGRATPRLNSSPTPPTSS